MEQLDESSSIKESISKAKGESPINDFFTLYKLGDWNLVNYKVYLDSQNRSLVFNALKEEFILNLERIKKLDTIDTTIKRKIGSIIKSQNSIKSTEVAPQSGTKVIQIGTIHNDGNMNIANDLTCSNALAAASNNDRGKKRKQTITTKSNTFWQEWEKILDACSSRNHHKFCLEKAHVIQCGTEIKCMPYVPSNLYDHPMFEEEERRYPFRKYGEYAMDVLTRINEKKPYTTLHNEVFDKDLNDGSRGAVFLHTFFQKLSIYSKRKETILKSEINYNYRFLWPMIDTAIDSDEDNYKNLCFKPGEVIMKIAKNAKIDALVTMYDAPLLTLETSGTFSNKDKPRSGFDHIKAAFCTLSFLKNIVKTYQWGNVETLLKLKILTIHAYDDKINLWSMRATDTPKVKIYKRIGVATIPNNPNEFITDALGFGNFLYTLMIELNDIQNILAKLKVEHDTHLRSILIGNSSPRPSLPEVFQFTLESPDRGKGFGILLPSTSISSDDEENIPPPSPSST